MVEGVCDSALARGETGARHFGGRAKKAGGSVPANHTAAARTPGRRPVLPSRVPPRIMAAAAAFPDHPPSGPRARGRPRHWSWQFYRPIGDVKATTRRRSAQCTLCDLVLDDARPDRFVAHLAEACALAPPDLRTSVA